ncbi:MAG: hypothetical protein JWM47_1648 [Acidimicrobiales bacterium]|nr:hypothetical protein [Acidimicrobiales bacterium]
MKRGNERYHYLTDGRGSIDSLTDAKGQRVQAYRYDPWGRTTANLGNVDQPFRWNSEYALNDFDYKIGARWYDASLGRWTQRDPSGQDPNPYAYANNDPINHTDPSGLDTCGKDWNIGGIVDCGSKAADEFVDRAWTCVKGAVGADGPIFVNNVVHNRAWIRGAISAARGPARIHPHVAMALAALGCAAALAADG